MCKLVITAVAKGNRQVAEDVRRLLGRAKEAALPKTAKELVR